MELCILCDYFIGALLNTIRISSPIKCIKHQQTRFCFVDVILLYFSQQHVSATRDHLQGDFFQNKNTVMSEKMSKSLNSFINHNLCLRFSVE